MKALDGRFAIACGLLAHAPLGAAQLPARTCMQRRHSSPQGPRCVHLTAVQDARRTGSWPRRVTCESGPLKADSLCRATYSDAKSRLMLAERQLKRDSGYLGICPEHASNFRTSMLGDCVVLVCRGAVNWKWAVRPCKGNAATVRASSIDSNPIKTQVKSARRRPAEATDRHLPRPARFIASPRQAPELPGARPCASLPDRSTI